MRRIWLITILATIVAFVIPGVGHAASFGATSRLGDESASDLDVAVGAAGDAAVVWKTTSGLHVARHDAGADPSQWRAEVLATGDVRGIPSVVVTPSGATVVAFEPSTGAAGAPVTVASAARGRSFRPAVRMSPPSRYRTWPALAVLSSGRVILAFIQRTELRRGALRVAVRPATDSRFSAPRTVGRAAEPPAVVPSDQGAIVTWRSAPHASRSSPGLRRDLLARRLDRVGRPAGERSVLSRSAGFWNVGAGAPAGLAIAAWSWSAPGRQTNRMLACRMVGTPVRCEQRRGFGPLWSGRDVPSLAAARRAAAIGFVVTPPGGGALPVFSTLPAIGGWSPSRALSGAPVGSSSRLLVVPGSAGGFDAFTAQSLGVFRLTGEDATGPVQVLGTVGDPSSVAADGNARTTVVAWTGPGSAGRTGPVEAAVTGPD